MSTLQTFTKRTGYRLVTILNNNFGVRIKAKQVHYVVDQEIDNILANNKKCGTCINEGALQFLVYQEGGVPKTKVKQLAWLKSTILRLDEYKPL
jgi:hypothetical protein